MPRLSSLLLAAVIVPVISSALQAQLPVPRDSATAMPRDSIVPLLSRDRLNVDVTLGAGGIAGAERDRVLGALDFSIGLRLHRFASGSLFLTAAAGAYRPRTASRFCPPEASFDCYALRSSSSSLSALLGWEPWRGGRQDWRLHVGPTVFESELGAHAGGLRTRVDFALPAGRFLGFVA